MISYAMFGSKLKRRSWGGGGVLDTSAGYAPGRSTENACSQFETCWLPAIKRTHVRNSKRAGCQPLRKRMFAIRNVLVASH